jgi:hypothetical protein
MRFKSQRNEEVLCMRVNLCAKQVPMFLKEHFDTEFRLDDPAEVIMIPQKCSCRNIWVNEWPREVRGSSRANLSR